jgi:hypothetical protein
MEEKLLALTGLWHIRSSVFYDSMFLGSPIVSKAQVTFHAFLEYLNAVIPNKDALYTKDGKLKRKFVYKRGALNNSLIDLIEELTKD